MRCSGESQQVVDAALLPSAGTQKGYRGTCSSHFIFNPPTFLEMCSELGFAFPFICPCNDFFYCSSYSRCMWSGGSSRNLLSLIKRWVFDGILNADFRYRSVCGVLRPQMEAAEPCSECIIHKCLKKHNFIRPRCSEVLFPLWYQHSLREKKLIKCGYYQFQGLDLKPVGHFHGFQEKVELFLKSILWVLICTSADRHGHAWSVIPVWIWLSIYRTVRGRIIPFQMNLMAMK